MATDYTNGGGTGDRRAIITISASTGLVINGGATRLIDGSSGAGCYFNSQAVSSQYISFDFGATASKVIDEIRFTQTGSNQHGEWRIQVSNDLSSWTNIGSTFTLGGSTRSIVSAISTNTMGYRAYRLFGISGNTTVNPYLHEFEFKIDNYTLPASTTIHGLFFCHG
jgi:hypothetical protein